ncbi:MAG TPA: TlpA disulfide reductase family protein [Pyrinomonadaceae bacterium]|nr:TlpA disulfide reductase family protein [Pyrinomonadaceae bacterium]
MVFALSAMSAGVLSFDLARASAQSRPQSAVAVSASESAGLDAAALYEEAAGYTRRKVAEAQKNSMPFDQRKLAEEARDLALRHATALAARGPAKGLDLYHLGLLYHLAEKQEAALGSLRRFLTENTDLTPAVAQNAHMVLLHNAVRLGLLEEAEKWLASYARVEPAKPGERYRVEYALASAYFQKGKFEQAAPHARESFKAARAFFEKASNKQQRDEALLRPAMLLADSLTKAGKRDDSVATLHELRRLALALPSAGLYDSALRALHRHGEIFSAESAAFNQTEPGVLAPELTVDSWLDQPPVTLNGLRGRVVLLDFWATWCRPCVFTIPKLNTLHKKYKERGLVVLGLTRFEGAAEGREMTQAEELAFLQQFKKKFGSPYGYAVAESTDNSLNYGVASLPTAVLIDRRGRVRHFVVGVYPGSDRELTSMVEKLLGEP